MNEKIYLGRGIAFIPTIFVFNALITGKVPMLIRIGYPTAVIWLLIIYDEALSKLENKKSLHRFPPV